MQKRFFMISGFVLIICAVIFGATQRYGPMDVAVAADEQKDRAITVVGSAERLSMPTMAYLDIGVVTQGENLKTVQEENAQKVANVLSAVKEMGIAEEDIQTSGFHVAPQYDNEPQASITGYTITHSVTVILRDINQVGEVFDEAVAQGANYAGSIRLDLDQKAKEGLYEEALREAIDEGEGKAKAIADHIGVHISSPTQVLESETQGDSPVVFQEHAMRADATQGTGIEPGEMAVRASVTLVYQMN